MKRILSIVMTLVLLWGLTMPAAAAAAVGTTLRLEKTEGTVTVESASGKSLSLRNGMRLYSGTKIKTSEGSYAYISLDSGKAVKLDASSESEVRKSGKKLELNLLSGELFFDVTVPLEKDESLNIRTSTMVTGVRGTSGYAVVYDCYHSEIVLLEGHLTVHKALGSTGGSMVEINGGEKAIAAPLREEQNDQIQLTVESVKEESVPGFVAVEVKDDLNLQDRIDKNSPLSVPKIIGDAQQRLEADEKQAAEAAKETQKKLDEQQKEEEKSKPDQMFESKGENVGGGGGGGSSKPPAPSEVTLTGRINSADLAAALARANKVILAGDVVLTVDEDVEIPAGKTVTMRSGATATVETGKTMTVTDTMKMENGSSLTNNGEFAINSTNSLHLGGTFTNKGELSVGTEDGSAGLLELNADGKLINSSLVNVYAGSTLRNAGTIDSDSTGIIAVRGGASMDNTGTFGMTGGELNLSATATLTNSGTINMGGGVLNSDGVDLTNSGIFNMTSGIFKSKGTALVNQGTATISGGTMSGFGCVIDTSAGEGLTLQSGEHPPVVMLEDEVELKPGETKPDETKPCVIRGQFTWKDGSLKAKSTYYFPNYPGGPAEIENRGNDGYYTATFAGDVRNLTWREFSWLQAALNIPHVKTVNLDLTGSDSGMRLEEGLTVPEGTVLNLKNGTLVNAEGKMLTNNGTITLSGGQLLNLGGVENGMNHSLTLENGATIQNGDKQASNTPATFISQGTLTIGLGCAFENTGSFTNEGTCTNGGTFNHNGTGSNEKDFINNGTFVCTAEFTNSGTFENGANAACNVEATFTNNGTFDNNGAKAACNVKATFTNNGTFDNNGANAACNVKAEFVNSEDATFKNGANAVCNVEATFTNNGTFVNNSISFKPGTTFYTKGKYQETITRNDLVAMETSLGDGRVLRFVTLSNWGNWNNNTKVTLYGGDGSYRLTGDDTKSFRSIGKTVTVTLDLNGQHLDMGNEHIEVAGKLTICDSSEGHNGSIIASKPDGTKPPVRAVNGGTCTVDPNSSITITPSLSSPAEPPATKTESGKTSAAASAQKPDASLTPTPEPGAGEGAKTETGEHADAKPETGAEETKPEAKVEEHADAKPEEKVEKESAAAQGTGSEQ